MTWKNRNFPAIVAETFEHVCTKLISHSISPHKEGYVSKVPYEQNATIHQHNPYCNKYWDKAQCESAIKELIEKGFTPGRPIMTSYNNPGKIKRFRDIPDGGLNFTGKLPNLIIIERDKMPNMDNLYFNEEELKFIDEAANDC